MRCRARRRPARRLVVNPLAPPGCHQDHRSRAAGTRRNRADDDHADQFESGGKFPGAQFNDTYPAGLINTQCARRGDDLRRWPPRRLPPMVGRSVSPARRLPQTGSCTVTTTLTALLKRGLRQHDSRGRCVTSINAAASASAASCNNSDRICGTSADAVAVAARGFCRAVVRARGRKHVAPACTEASAHQLRGRFFAQWRLGVIAAILQRSMR